MPVYMQIVTRLEIRRRFIFARSVAAELIKWLADETNASWCATMNLPPLCGKYCFHMQQQLRNYYILYVHVIFPPFCRLFIEHENLRLTKAMWWQESALCGLALLTASQPNRAEWKQGRAEIKIANLFMFFFLALVLVVCFCSVCGCAVPSPVPWYTFTLYGVATETFFHSHFFFSVFLSYVTTS